MHLNRVSHALSHHPRPNTEWDLEILGLEPWMYNMVNRQANSPWIAAYGPVLCASAHLLDIVGLWTKLLMGKQPFRIEMLSNILQLAVLCAFRASLLDAFLIWCTMLLVFGAIDSYAGFPLHHTEAAWTEGTLYMRHAHCCTLRKYNIDAGFSLGDTAHERKLDMGEHIMASTVDYDTVGILTGVNVFSFVVAEWLNG